MKYVIVSEKGREKKRELVRKNIDKIALAEIVIMSTLFDLSGRYM